jgi:hypothetical protein
MDSCKDVEAPVHIGQAFLADTTWILYYCLCHLWTSTCSFKFIQLLQRHDSNRFTAVQLDMTRAEYLSFLALIFSLHFLLPIKDISRSGQRIFHSNRKMCAMPHIEQKRVCIHARKGFWESIWASISYGIIHSWTRSLDHPRGLSVLIDRFVSIWW